MPVESPASETNEDPPAEDPRFSLLRKPSSEDENPPPDVVEKNADGNPPIAVELSADPTSETQELSEPEPDHEAE